MDITPFANDIGELVKDFVKIEGIELAQMKDLWRARNFSLIHEAQSNNVTPIIFMQALYSCALGHMVDELSYSERVGGLYILYILYETQQSKPPIKIYLSYDELKGIHALVIEAKEKCHVVALKVIQKMMEKDMFLFGAVCASQKKMAIALVNLEAEAASHLEFARNKVLSSLPLEQHLKGDLVEEFGLDEVATISQEYSTVKQRIFDGSGYDKGLEDVLKMKEQSFGDELREETREWMERKESLLGKNKDHPADDTFASQLYQILDDET